MHISNTINYDVVIKVSPNICMLTQLVFHIYPPNKEDSIWILFDLLLNDISSEMLTPF